MKKTVRKKIVVNKYNVPINKEKVKIKLTMRSKLRKRKALHYEAASSYVTKKSKSKMGRPTLYDPSFILKVDEYLQSCGREQTTLPTLEGFTIFLDISMDALEDYRKSYPDFSGALERIMKYQKIQLINDGIYGGKEVNSTIVKLLLQNNHGMKEKIDNTTDGKPLPTPIYGGRSSG